MDIFLSWILKGLLLVFGLFGNLIGLIVFRRKHMAHFSARLIYIALAIFDSLFLSCSIVRYFFSNENINLLNFSKSTCKLYTYVLYFLSPISSWLLVFLSLNRFISIGHQQIRMTNKPTFQIWTITAIILYNLLFYMPTLFFISISNTELNNNTYEVTCHFNETKIETAIIIIDFMNAVMLPFTLMLILSILLIRTIFKSRLRIMRLTNQRDKNKLRKDIQFASSTIFSNLLFVILNLPVCILDLFHVSDDLRDYFYCVYLFSFCINFYVLFCVNSLFFK